MYEWLKVSIFDDESYWNEQSSESRKLIAARICSLLSQARVMNPENADSTNGDGLFEVR